jgi:hypothetical protein
MIPLTNHDSSEGDQWGRYNLPRPLTTINHYSSLLTSINHTLTTINPLLTHPFNRQPPMFQAIHRRSRRSPEPRRLPRAFTKGDTLLSAASPEAVALTAPGEGHWF